MSVDSLTSPFSNKTCQLCGPVTGRPRHEAEADFMDAAAALMAAGARSVWNPMVHVSPDATHEQAMLRCLGALTMRDEDGSAHVGALVTLPGWETSEGARLEAAVARACGIEVVGLSGASG